MERQKRIWFVDQLTLRDVVVDRNALEARLEGCTGLERRRVLSILEGGKEPLNEAEQLPQD